MFVGGWLVGGGMILRVMLGEKSESVGRRPGIIALDAVALRLPASCLGEDCWSEGRQCFI